MCKGCENCCQRFNRQNNMLMGEGEIIPRPPTRATDHIPAIIEATELDCKQTDARQLELWGKRNK
jgi:hypothetical protein